MPYPVKSELFQAPPGHFALQIASGRTTAFVCEADSRASYFLYVPSVHNVSRRARGEDVTIDSDRKLPLVVLVHGALRNAEEMRDRWSETAEREGFVALCPLFPSEVLYPGLIDYKFILSASGVRYDHLLLNIVETVQRNWGGVETDKFYLAGFSGGGQFSHRFLYLHSDRLRAVSIGAPGTCTTLSNKSWPEGVGNVRDTFGLSVDLAALSAVPVQLAVGAEDTSDLIGDDGKVIHVSRPNVMKCLAATLEEHGVGYELVIEEGIKHEEAKLQGVMEEFIIRQLRRVSCPLPK